MNCTNCNQEISGEFCAHCGQKSFQRIDGKYILEELQYTVLQADKGLLYSIRQVVKNPGKTAREFVEGHRIHHYKPIAMVFVLSGISAFLMYKVLGLRELIVGYYAQHDMGSPFMDDLYAFVASYNSILMLALIPVFAFMTKLAFRQWGHNYYEHIVMNAYILSLYGLFEIFLIFPLGYVFRERLEVVTFLCSFLGIILIPFFLVWFFKGFYSEASLKKIIGRVLSIVLYVVLGYVILFISVIIFTIIYVTIAGPEALEYFTF